jgi:hypothetical protein
MGDRAGEPCSHPALSAPASEPGLVHLYGQAAWHDDAKIKGDRNGLLLLLDALNAAIANGSAVVTLFAADGEGYRLTIELDAAMKEADHYHDLP